MKPVEIYSQGLIFTSVCADSKLTVLEVETYVNMETPSGVTPWRFCDDHPTFQTGEANPHTCERDPSRKHYLLAC